MPSCGQFGNPCVTGVLGSFVSPGLGLNIRAFVWVLDIQVLGCPAPGFHDFGVLKQVVFVSLPFLNVCGNSFRCRVANVAGFASETMPRDVLFDVGVAPAVRNRWCWHSCSCWVPCSLGRAHANTRVPGIFKSVLSSRLWRRRGCPKARCRTRVLHFGL